MCPTSNLQVIMSSQSSQRSGTHGNTFETTCGTSFAKKCSSHQHSRLVLPQIKIRRDPKLLMQEAPVLASRMQRRSNAGSPGPRLLPDCNTGRKPWKLRRPEGEYDHRCKICRVFHLLSTCAAAVRCTLLRYSCKSSSPTAPSSAVSLAWMAGLGCLSHTVATGAPHRIAILGSITRSALAILALGRSQK